MGTTNKSTHAPYNTELFAPIVKSAEGKYIAVLSDTSTDRDEERVGKQAIHIMEQSGYVAGLIDHENKVLNQVCQWKNIHVVEIDGHTALIAEPKFFLSNPKAKQIKGMLDEGAEIGISIGAIVKAYDDMDVNGQNIRTFTDLELLEASFVAIPSNRHGRAMAVAKSFNVKDNKKKMSENKYTKEDIDSAVLEANKGFETKFSDLNKQLESKESEFSEMKKSVEEKEQVVVDVTKKFETATEKVKELEKSLEAAKKVAIEKQNFANQSNDKDKDAPTKEEIDKALSEGKLPVMRMN